MHCNKTFVVISPCHCNKNFVEETFMIRGKTEQFCPTNVLYYMVNTMSYLHKSKERACVELFNTGTDVFLVHRFYDLSTRPLCIITCTRYVCRLGTSHT